jgi:glycosyltransferase involved in cell wall biosynthesis
MDVFWHLNRIREVEDTASEARDSVRERYRWLGEVPRWKALRVLTRCRLLVVTSELEGGANAVSEALAASVPVLSSRIGGSVGLLGADYAGYFPVGDTAALAELLHRVEMSRTFIGRCAIGAMACGHWSIRRVSARAGMICLVGWVCRKR